MSVYIQIWVVAGGLFSLTALSSYPTGLNFIWEGVLEQVNSKTDLVLRSCLRPWDKDPFQVLRNSAQEKKTS